MKIQALLAIIDTWKINRALLACKMNMPKGTFNNKLNPGHSAYFSNAEINRLCTILIDLREDLRVINIV